MEKNLQDRAWGCLPKEAREELRAEYQNAIEGSDLEDFLIDFFGHHNLASDTEPEEMLMVERKKVQEYKADIEYTLAGSFSSEYSKGYWRGQQTALDMLFNDKCLPDKEQPKFKVGDNVAYIDNFGVIFPEILTIKGISVAEDGKYCYEVIEYGIKYPERNLELFPVEKETTRKILRILSLSDKQSDETKDTMEEKELNLCELLKGCEGEKFFSISVGEIIFKAIYDYDDTFNIRTIRKDAVGNEYNVNFHSDGRRNKSGLPDLYPSEDLLKKYPLDAKKAWDEWAETRKTKRWTPQIGEHIFWVNANLTVSQDRFNDFDTQRKRRAVGNEFKTGKEAKQAAEGIREYLKSFHEKHKEQ